MTVRFIRPITAQSRFGQEILRSGQADINASLHAVGADAVRRVDLNVAKRYNNARTGFQSKGDTKLEGSFSYRVVEAAGTHLPAQLIVTSSADDAKVGALEHGSPPHPIVAKDAPFLVFERNPRNVFGKRLDAKLGPQKALRQKSARSRPKAAGKSELTRVKAVEHPGNREGRFMRDGLESAIRAAYRRVSAGR